MNRVASLLGLLPANSSLEIAQVVIDAVAATLAVLTTRTNGGTLVAAGGRTPGPQSLPTQAGRPPFAGADGRAARHGADSSAAGRTVNRTSLWSDCRSSPASTPEPPAGSIEA